MIDRIQLVLFLWRNLTNTIYLHADTSAVTPGNPQIPLCNFLIQPWCDQSVSITRLQLGFLIHFNSLAESRVLY